MAYAGLGACPRQPAWPFRPRQPVAVPRKPPIPLQAQRAGMLATHIGTRQGIRPAGPGVQTMEGAALAGIFDVIKAPFKAAVSVVKAVAKPAVNVAASLVPGGAIVKNIAQAAVQTFTGGVKQAAGTALQQAGQQAAGAALRSPKVRSYAAASVLGALEPYLVPAGIGLALVLLLRGGGGGRR